MYMKGASFFKEKQLDDAIFSNIIAAAGCSFVQKGQWVYKHGDPGDELYIILHGQCESLEDNMQFLEYRRSLREKHRQMFDNEDKLLELEK